MLTDMISLHLMDYVSMLALMGNNNNFVVIAIQLLAIIMFKFFKKTYLV